MHKIIINYFFNQEIGRCRYLRAINPKMTALYYRKIYFYFYSIYSKSVNEIIPQKFFYKYFFF